MIKVLNVSINANVLFVKFIECLLLKNTIKI